jgi:hypothetical protein
MNYIFININIDKNNNPIIYYNIDNINPTIDDNINNDNNPINY